MSFEAIIGGVLAMAMVVLAWVSGQASIKIFRDGNWGLAAAVAIMAIAFVAIAAFMLRFVF